MNVIMPVFIQNEETLELTKSAIYSLGDCRLIVIDNDSSIGGGYLRSVADIYIRNKENLGYAKAVNQGLKLYDKDEVVAIPNNDTRISNGWQEVALNIMKDSTVGSVHFKMIPYEQPFSLGDKVWITGKERWCTGSFFVMRNKWLFDENFFNSEEDWDIHLRMYKEGYKTAYTNKASYQHLDSFTQQFIPEKKENDKKNQDYFIKKHGEHYMDIWRKMFPEQMNQDYRKGFDI